MSKPNAPGYYIARIGGGEEIVEVVKITDEGALGVLRMGRDGAFALEAFDFGRLVAMTVEAAA